MASSEHPEDPPRATASISSYPESGEYDHSGHAEPGRPRSDSRASAHHAATDSPYPPQHTFSPHIPPASTGMQLPMNGSSYASFSPHAHFSETLGSEASPRHHFSPLREPHALGSPGDSQGHSIALPEIGHVRCYWSVLSADLEYAYLGPVFAAHLGPEVSERLVGTSLLDWVHPDERDQLAQDLLPRPDRVAGVEETGVFGSVTRCRFSRITRMMRNLGHPNVPEVPEAQYYAIDDDWLDVDLTTSWIAGDCSPEGGDRREGDGPTPGAVLAFFHVSNDKDPVQDNDEHVRNGWSNWCGLSMDWGTHLLHDRCGDLVDTLKRLTQRPGSRATTGESDRGGEKGTLSEVLNDRDSHGAAVGTGGPSPPQSGPPSHVFQILDQLGRPIVTFPEPTAPHPYDVERYSALAQEVMARPSEAAPSKTSCTRRYRSKHPELRAGGMRTIESVVIMYGDITFACFQTGGVYLSPRRDLPGLSMPEGPSFDVATAEGKHFALENVPTTPTVNERKRYPFDEDAEERDDEAHQPAKRRPTLQPPVLPKLQTSAPSPVGENDPAKPAGSPPAATPGQGQGNGLSITTSSNMFRQNLDVETTSAGGISPTVASASAILGSLGDAAAGMAQRPKAALPRSPLQNSSTLPDNANLPLPAYASQPHYAAASMFSYPPTSVAPSAMTHAPVPPPAQGPYLPSLPRSPFDPMGAAGPSGQQTPPGEVTLPVPAPLRDAESSREGSDGGEGSKQVSPPTEDEDGVKGGGAKASAKKANDGGVGKKSRQRPDGPIFKPNVKACESCGTVNSPEWRKGPSGNKSLCNACGLRYARQVTRQRKQAEIEANGGPPPKKAKKKAGKGAKAVKDEPQDEKSGGEEHYDPSSTGSATPALPQPTHHGGYDQQGAGYSHASTPGLPDSKAYSPYYSTAPPVPGQYSHAGSSGLPQAPQYPSPLANVSAPGYFPTMTPLTTMSSYAYPMAVSAPLSGHSLLPPVPIGQNYSLGGGGAYDLPPPAGLPTYSTASLQPPNTSHSPHSPYSHFSQSPHIHSPNPGPAPQPWNGGQQPRYGQQQPHHHQQQQQHQPQQQQQQFQWPGQRNFDPQQYRQQQPLQRQAGSPH